MRAITAWIMLIENNEFNGSFYVIPESHKIYISCAGVTNKKNYAQSLKKQRTGVPRPETMQRILQNMEIQSIHGNAGTMAFHDCNILHASPDNISEVPRTVLMLVFNSCDNALEKPFSYQSPRPKYLRNTDASALELSQTCMQTG
ncbi:MAG: phytanoyl-CoA dioxygenase family protein [Gammaproteobacteria bacterium]|nr:phytanoyl-CoA dioxygenase family protein [Gammaproteobacteria bacterium]